MFSIPNLERATTSTGTRSAKRQTVATGAWLTAQAVMPVAAVERESAADLADEPETPRGRRPARGFDADRETDFATRVAELIVEQKMQSDGSGSRGS